MMRGGTCVQGAHRADLWAVYPCPIVAPRLTAWFSAAARQNDKGDETMLLSGYLLSTVAGYWLVSTADSRQPSHIAQQGPCCIYGVVVWRPCNWVRHALTGIAGSLPGQNPQKVHAGLRFPLCYREQTVLHDASGSGDGRMGVEADGWYRVVGGVIMQKKMWRLVCTKAIWENGENPKRMMKLVLGWYLDSAK
mmetsp:Transcript_17972/g.31925  ORF Transcript_17972/g.31925 Transcript_17972/m.31925 type:complete len:193 (-) Transcript_17972:102-680(-)